MTKREFTSLMVAFLGAWLVFQALVSLLSPLLVFLTSALSGFHSQAAATTLVVMVVTVLIYSCFGVAIIRKADPLASWLLRRANLAADGRMDGLEVINFLPGMISLLGLYFLIRYVPELVITGIKWFTFEARSGDFLSVGGSDQFIAKAQSSIAYNSAVVAISLFVFLRADVLGRWVARFRKVPNQLSQQTLASGTPPAGQEPRHR